MEAPRVLPGGDSGLYLVFGDRVDLSVNAEVHRFASAIRQARIAGITDIIPGYVSLYVGFDPRAWSDDTLSELLRNLRAGDSEVAVRAPLSVPVAYGDEFGPDLATVAEHAGMSPDEVIAVHSTPEYQVYFVGFTPGFAFLGGMDPRLDTPRLGQPRLTVPAGSVGIAGLQTGVYPVESPGGWQLIGRTPLALYDPSENDPILLRPGDKVRFVVMSAQDYLAEAGRVFRPSSRR